MCYYYLVRAEMFRDNCCCFAGTELHQLTSIHTNGALTHVRIHVARLVVASEISLKPVTWRSGVLFLCLITSHVIRYTIKL
jgi:hypothetical protein